eukprot:m.29253 g.29253  ORF g.29253 m.29253 type:complete len:289 (+) comp6135_c0_seq1:1126-1992(+)
MVLRLLDIVFTETNPAANTIAPTPISMREMPYVSVFANRLGKMLKSTAKIATTVIPIINTRKKLSQAGRLSSTSPTPTTPTLTPRPTSSVIPTITLPLIMLERLNFIIVGKMPSTEELETMKSEGSALLKEGKYKEALRKYHFAHLGTRSVISMQQTSSSMGQLFGGSKGGEESSGDQLEKMKILHTALLGNMALCHLKLKKYDRVVALCTEILQMEKENIKALWRRASANIELKNLGLAEADVKQGLEFDPENADMKKLEAKLGKLNTKYQEKADKFLSNNLQKMWG